MVEFGMTKAQTLIKITMVNTIEVKKKQAWLILHASK